MHWIYFDASALIKRYSQETGTPLVNEVFRYPPPCVPRGWRFDHPRRCNQ